MKKVLIFTLAICILAFSAALADETASTGDVGGNVAVRYYPTTTDFGGGTSFNISNIWAEGNLYVGKDRKWKGSIEWFGGNKSKTFNGVNVKCTESQATGRIGYDLWEKTYLSVDYKSNKFTFGVAGFGTGSGTFDGIGFGVDKEWGLSKQWILNTNLHYFPTLSGPNKWDYRDLEYEIGLVYKIPSAVNIDAGFRGESWTGFNKAKNTTVTIAGPYLGISKDF